MQYVQLISSVTVLSVRLPRPTPSAQRHLAPSTSTSSAARHLSLDLVLVLLHLAHRLHSLHDLLDASLLVVHAEARRAVRLFLGVRRVPQLLDAAPVISLRPLFRLLSGSLVDLALRVRQERSRRLAVPAMSSVHVRDSHQLTWRTARSTAISLTRQSEGNNSHVAPVPACPRQWAAPRSSACSPASCRPESGRGP